MVIWEQGTWASGRKRGKWGDRSGSGRPPHRSGRAALLHPVLTLDSGVEALLGPRVIPSRGGKPSALQAMHPVPGRCVSLSSALQRSKPQPRDLIPEYPEPLFIAGDSVVGEIASYHLLQPPSLFGNRLMPTVKQLDFDLAQLRAHPLLYRLALHSELPAPMDSTDVCESQE